MPDLITIKDAARVLACHPMTVRRLIKKGALGDVVRGNHQFVRIHRDALDAYISRHTEGKKHD